MTTLENLEMGAFLRSDKAEIAKNHDWAFEFFPILKSRGKQLGGTLSGGEQQMLAMARGQSWADLCYYCWMNPH